MTLRKAFDHTLTIMAERLVNVQQPESDARRVAAVLRDEINKRVTEAPYKRDRFYNAYRNLDRVEVTGDKS